MKPVEYVDFLSGGVDWDNWLAQNSPIQTMALPMLLLPDCQQEHIEALQYEVVSGITHTMLAKPATTNKQEDDNMTETILQRLLSFCAVFERIGALQVETATTKSAGDDNNNNEHETDSQAFLLVPKLKSELQVIFKLVVLHQATHSESLSANVKFETLDGAPEAGKKTDGEESTFVSAFRSMTLEDRKQLAQDVVARIKSPNAGECILRGLALGIGRKLSSAAESFGDMATLAIALNESYVELEDRRSGVLSAIARSPTLDPEDIKALEELVACQVRLEARRQSLPNAAYMNLLTDDTQMKHAKTDVDLVTMFSNIVSETLSALCKKTTVKKELEEDKAGDINDDLTEFEQLHSLYRSEELLSMVRLSLDIKAMEGAAAIEKMSSIEGLRAVSRLHSEIKELHHMKNHYHMERIVNAARESATQRGVLPHLGHIYSSEKFFILLKQINTFFGIGYKVPP